MEWTNIKAILKLATVEKMSLVSSVGKVCCVVKNLQVNLRGFEPCMGRLMFFQSVVVEK